MHSIFHGQRPLTHYKPSYHEKYNGQSQPRLIKYIGQRQATYYQPADYITISGERSTERITDPE
jgi:hypothetical protein